MIISATLPTLLDFEPLSSQEAAREIQPRPLPTQVMTYLISGMHSKGIYYKRGSCYNTLMSNSFIYVNALLQFLKNTRYLLGSYLFYPCSYPYCMSLIQNDLLLYKCHKYKCNRYTCNTSSLYISFFVSL